MERTIGPYKANTIVVGDCLEVLRQIPDGVFQCTVCSPPYWGQRDYGIPPVVRGGDPLCEHDWGAQVVTDHRGTQLGKAVTVDAREATRGQFCLHCNAWLGSLGLEPTSELYVEHIVEVFREVRRVLRDDGTLWLNMGDAYFGAKGGKWKKDNYRPAREHEWIKRPAPPPHPDLKTKDLCGLPWRLALALRADGWWLRSDIIWAKGVSFLPDYAGSCMPESVGDRPTKSHEYVFLLSKSRRYFYDQDAIREPLAFNRWSMGNKLGSSNRDIKTGQGAPGQSPHSWERKGHSGYFDGEGNPLFNPAGRNLRTVWVINPERFPGAHFATFPPKLVEPMIKAGTSERGACPECGKAWVRVRELVERHIGGGSPGVPEEARGTFKHRQGSSQSDRPGLTQSEHGTVGWQPACSCGLPDGFRPDDFELVETPTGERTGEDPSLVTGRAGYNRPRGANEGKRTITRYEQRKYAEQLKNSPRRAEMATQAGPAFAHYIRTDKSGARPIPPGLLEAWLESGQLEQVQVPEWEPPGPVPCIVLDPFAGAGTTLTVADGRGCDWLGIDINPEYAVMSQERIRGDRRKRAQLKLF